MRLIKIVFVFLLIIGSNSCDIIEEYINDYSGVLEINLPTEHARGLAYDGDFLWYSDDSLNTIIKISSEGIVLETISIANSSLSGFEFFNNSIWCINDQTVLFDTVNSHYPYSCIYELSLAGDKMDSILIMASINPQKPEFLGITFNKYRMFGSTNQGWSSCLYEIDPETETKIFLQYHSLTGLTSRDDTIYGIDISYLNKN